MDPLSITTGVITLLGVCINVGNELKKFYDEVGSVNETVAGLRDDVEALTKVLNTMRASFDSVPRPMTGHVGTHWENIYRSLKDGNEALTGLHEVVQKIGKDVSILSGPRKHLRLKAAEDKISQFRKQVQSFRDTLQLSMQALILWNQVSIQGAHDRILPNLEDIQRDIRGLATGLSGRISSLQSVAAASGGNSEEKSMTLAEMVAMNNLRNCVRSAATIVSSASTILGRNEDPEATTYYGSEFGDVFPSQTSDSTMEWLSSTALSSAPSASTDISQPVPAVSRKELPELEISDSDSDLDVDLALGLYRKGLVKFRLDDFTGAEPLLRNCLSRLMPAAKQGRQRGRKPNTLTAHDVLALLCQTCMRLEKWEEAASVMMEKIALSPRGLDSKSALVLDDVSNLVTILYAKKDYVQGHLYARKLLRGYRRLGTSGEDGVERTLILLVEICKASGNSDEEEAYSIMLEGILEKKAVKAVQEAVRPINEEDEEGADVSPAVELAELEASVEILCQPDVKEPKPKNLEASTPDPPQTSEPPTSPDTPTVSSSVAREDQAENRVMSTTAGHSLETHNEAAVGDVRIQSSYSPSNKHKIHHHLKQLVIVGDGAAGKSLLLYHQSYGNVNKVKDDYFVTAPGSWETFRTVVTIADHEIDFRMLDSPGQEDYDRLRALIYPGTHVALILFSKAFPDSLDNVREKWLHEVLHFLPMIPTILVGNQKDLEHDPETIAELRKTGQHPVTYEEGLAAAKELGISKYLECSAKTGEGVREVFESAAVYAIERTKVPPTLLRRLFRRKA